MRDFLYKNSFIRYYLSLFNRNIAYKKRGTYLLVLLFVFGGMLSAFWSAGAALYGFYVFFICAFLGVYRRSQPNLSGLMPLTGRRKITYQYLSPLFTMILIFVGLLITGFLSYLFISVYFLITRLYFKFNYFSAVWSGITESFVNMGVYGTAFAVIFTLFSYSCGTVYGFLTKTLHRAIFVAVYFFIIYFGFYGIAYPSIKDYYFASGFASPFSYHTYENMQLPWLCILLSAIVAVCSFAGSVVYLNKRIGKKGF